MATEKKRVRSENYTREEEVCLIGLVKLVGHIVENKKIDATTSREKTKAWEEVALEYNARNGTQRTADQLRQKFDSLKKYTKKYVQQQRLQENNKPRAERKPHPIYDDVMQIIKLSFDGEENHVDLDVATENEEHSTSVVDKNEELFSKIDFIEISEDVSVPLEKDDIPILMYVPPPRNYEERECPARAEKMIEDITSKSESSYEESLTPWIKAKTELVQLQIKHEKRQFEEDRKREQELFLLKKRSLELDIAIKEQNLKKLRAQLLSSFSPLV